MGIAVLILQNGKLRPEKLNNQKLFLLELIREPRQSGSNLNVYSKLYVMKLFHFYF